MRNEEIVAMGLVEYCELLVNVADFNGHGDPHRVNWDWTYFAEVISEERYLEANAQLRRLGYPVYSQRELVSGS